MENKIAKFKVGDIIEDGGWIGEVVYLLEDGYNDFYAVQGNNPQVRVLLSAMKKPKLLIK